MEELARDLDREAGREAVPADREVEAPERPVRAGAAVRAAVEACGKPGNLVVWAAAPEADRAAGVAPAPEQDQEAAQGPAEIRLRARVQGAVEPALAEDLAAEEPRRNRVSG